MTVELGYDEWEYARREYLESIAQQGNAAQFEAVINREAVGASQFQGWETTMAGDFEGAKPVRTVRDNEFRIALVDGASGDIATKILSIVGEGDTFVAATNDLGIPAMGKTAAGAAKILPIGTTGLIVEATNLDIRDLTAASDSVAIKNGSNELAIDASGFIGVTDGGGSLTVDASDLDIRNLSAAQDNVGISDGTDSLAINSDGSINVVVGAGGAEVSDYKTSAAVVKDTVVNHDYTITNAKTFGGLKVLVGGSTQLRVQVGTWDGTTFVVFATYFQNARENFDHNISALSFLGDGSTKKIRVAIKNLDAASAVYSTLQGIES